MWSAGNPDFLDRLANEMTGRRSVCSWLLIALVGACTPASRGEVPALSTQHLSPAVPVECQEASVDSDGDGLSDDCELRFAQAFAPALRVRSGGCNWDDTVAPPRLGGGYLFGVEPQAEGGARIAYLPAYFRDCGWSGPKCWLPFVDCDPHIGDSEFIVLDVARTALDGAWRTAGIFLSAHCFGRSASACRWYRGNELSAFAWGEHEFGGAPVIWVAEGRQANYPSWQACDRGHASIDTCDQHDTEYRFPIHSSCQNIGSAANPIGCATASALGSPSLQPAVDAEECIWDEQARFFGWQGSEQGGGATPYARYLREIGQLIDGKPDGSP